MEYLVILVDFFLLLVILYAIYKIKQFFKRTATVFVKHNMEVFRGSVLSENVIPTNEPFMDMFDDHLETENYKHNDGNDMIRNRIRKQGDAKQQPTSSNTDNLVEKAVTPFEQGGLDMRNNITNYFNF